MNTIVTKFRAWHHGAGDPRVKPVMVYSESMKLSTFWKQVEQDDVAVEVMQFTGLKDKNGVEIYESDIVELPYGVQSIQFSDMTFYQPAHGYTETARVSGFYIGGYWGDPNKAIVIGNIYENPELLESDNA